MTSFFMEYSSKWLDYTDYLLEKCKVHTSI